MSPGVPCRYNRAIRIERGEFGDISLTGTKLWMAGERTESTTPDFHEWGEIAFDPSVMLEQQTALLTVIRALYPIQYMALTVDTPQAIEWSVGEDEASARMAEGSIAELLIEKNAAATPPPLASSGPRYGAAARIEKLVPMQSRLQAYREGPKAFDVGGGFGFVVTFDFSSGEVETAEEPPPTAPH